MNSRFLSLLSVFAKKELILASRTRDSLLSVLFFSFLTVLVFHFGFSKEGQIHASFITAFIFLATLFGGTLRLNQTFEPEREGKVAEALKLIPHVSLPFYISKFLFNFVFITIICIFSLVLILLLFNVPDPLQYIEVAYRPFLLGIFGIASVGTIFSNLAVSHGKRDILLPIILYPILVPLIIAVIKSFVYSGGGDAVAIEGLWLRILAVFDLIYFVLALMLCETLMES